MIIIPDVNFCSEAECRIRPSLQERERERKGRRAERKEEGRESEERGPDHAPES